MSEFLKINELFAFFSALIDDKVFKLIFEQTNQYRTQTIVGKKIMLLHILDNLIGFSQIWMRLRVSYRSYRAKTKELMFENEFATAAMSRNWFELLMTIKVIMIGETVSIDESDIIFRGSRDNVSISKS